MRPTSPRFVRDLMTVGVPTCPPETLVADVARLLSEKNFEEVVVDAARLSSLEVFIHRREAARRKATGKT